MKALLGTKIGMTQIISEDGKAVPVTLIQAGPVTVTQVKSVETDGYNAVQVGFDLGKNLSKAVAGHVKSSSVTPKYIREFRVESLPAELIVGATIDVNAFALGDIVDATVQVKVKVSPVRLNDTTLQPAKAHTVVTETFVNRVQSDRCTRKKSLKVSVWLAAWATTKLPSRTSLSVILISSTILSVYVALFQVLKKA